MKSKIYVLCLILVLVPNYANAEFLLGVGTHVYQQNIDKNIQMTREAGLNSIREDFDWGGVEKEKGKLIIPHKLGLYLRTSAEAHIAPLMILDYGNPFYDGGKKPVSTEGIAAFARYASFSAKQLRGQVNFFEIWNEWDQSAEPKSAESYFELVKVVAPAIKAVNNDVIVLAGAATTGGIRKGWTEKLVKLGILKYVDGISVHPYIHCERDKSPEAWLKFISATSIQLQKANGGKLVPIYVTEMGWPSNNGACGTSPDTVAQYLARVLLLVRTQPEVKGFWWYDLKNDGKNIEEREHNFGLLNYDYSLKPAFTAFQDVSKFVINAKAVEHQSSPKGIVSLVITDNSGKKTFALWSDAGKTINTSLSIVRERTAVPLVLKVGTGKSISIGPNSNTFVLKLDGTPQIITGVQNLIVNGKDNL